MLSKLKKDNKGFTIIEVMIVLAIAGLIILIVLLAVPALQRNGRNTAIKNDVGNVAGGISEYASNNDGTPAKVVTSAAGVVTVCDAAPCGATTTKTTIKIQGGTDVTTETAVTGGAVFGTLPDSGQIMVYPTNKCGTGNNAGAQTGVRSFAILYAIETSSGVTVKCQDA